jgi:hypothetical protein
VETGDAFRRGYEIGRAAEAASSEAQTVLAAFVA